jgi:hypothetical protein
VVAQEPLLTELRDRHPSLVGRTRILQEAARVTLFLFGYLVGPLVRVVSARGLVLAIGRPVDTDVSRAGSPGTARSRMPRRTSRPGDRERVRRNVRSTPDNGSQLPTERIYGGTSEIMKTIIARDLTGLRA